MLSSLRLPALLAICALCSTGGPAPADDIDIPYEKFVLDNGLTLIVHEDQLDYGEVRFTDADGNPQ